MIYAFFAVLFAEMAMILLLLFKTPLRKLLIFALDRMKRGRAPLVVKSVGATIFTIMIYQIYSISDMKSRPADAVGPTDQVIIAYQMLEASLIGCSIFLLLMIDRIHNYIRELRMLRKIMEAGKKQTHTTADGKKNTAEEVNALNEEISRLRSKISKLESENANMEKEMKSGKNDTGALKNQSESENQSLTKELSTGGKKDI